MLDAATGKKRKRAAKAPSSHVIAPGYAARRSSAALISCFARASNSNAEPPDEGKRFREELLLSFFVHTPGFPL